MAYDTLKFLHITGVVMLLGNVTATAIWKFFADRSRDPVVLAFAQKLVTYTDWSLTFWGIVLTVVGGYGMVFVAGIDPFGPLWLVGAQAMFVLSGAIWAGLLVPAQIRQARLAKAFRAGTSIPEAYWRDTRTWLVWGLIGTVPLVAAVWLMVVKPD
ncbi:hypothetical protein IP88_01765 [alpha proteobacterium AAP81b]|nr:hypothetical protein IP88_01765 [alpha proteobacterium AAP81b]